MAPHSNGEAAPKGCPSGALRRASAGPPQRPDSGWGAKPRAPARSAATPDELPRSGSSEARRARKVAASSGEAQPEVSAGRRPGRNGALIGGSRALRGAPPRAEGPLEPRSGAKNVGRLADGASSPGRRWEAATAACPTGQPAPVPDARRCLQDRRVERGCYRRSAHNMASYLFAR